MKNSPIVVSVSCAIFWAILIMQVMPLLGLALLLIINLAVFGYGLYRIIYQPIKFCVGYKIRFNKFVKELLYKNKTGASDREEMVAKFLKLKVWDLPVKKEDKKLLEENFEDYTGLSHNIEELKKSIEKVNLVRLDDILAKKFPKIQDILPPHLLLLGGERLLTIGFLLESYLKTHDISEKDALELLNYVSVKSSRDSVLDCIFLPIYEKTKSEKVYDWGLHSTRVTAAAINRQNVVKELVEKEPIEKEPVEKIAGFMSAMYAHKAQ